METVNVRLSETLLADIEAYAEQEMRDRSQMIRVLLTEAIVERKNMEAKWDRRSRDVEDPGVVGAVVETEEGRYTREASGLWRSPHGAAVSWSLIQGYRSVRIVSVPGTMNSAPTKGG